MDIAVISGTDVCASSDFSCYEAGSRDVPYPGPAYNGTKIDSGTVLATHRILLSYDRAFSANFTAGLRAGYALFGGPPAIESFDSENKPQKKISFLPVHAELRLAYWFGQGALAKKGLRPYAFIGGGMAQVDAKVKVNIYDCSGTTASPSAPGCTDPGQAGSIPKKTVDAWKKLGQGFIALGGGIVYAFTPQVGLQANLNFDYMLGSSGPVIQPSLGLVYGL
jgi:hypothetical protein